jgi:peptide chain release factor 2
MQDTKSRIKLLSQRFESFEKGINLAEKKSTLNSLEAQTLDPELWQNQDKAKRLLREFADLKGEISEIENLGETVITLNELSSDETLSKAESQLEKLTLKLLLSGKYDKKNALVSIHAGQGGVEAMDWASMILRMYLRFCEKRGWETHLVDMTSGEEAGVKSATFEVVGTYAYGYLKGESGTHRLVRQSPFNADRLRQTSFALVEVLPELEEVDLPDIKIAEEDLDWQFFRASSQGGQNVQKVSSAVRLTHKPTGIVVTAQSERFQEQNRKNALNLLRAKLWLLEEAKKENEKKEIKGEYHPASWGRQIRSYVLQPYKMVKDLRTEVETANTEAVLAGEIDEFVEAELKTNLKSEKL